MKKNKYYYPEEIDTILNQQEELKQFLYCRGYLLTTKTFTNKLNEYPFYGFWDEQELAVNNNKYYLYTHRDTKTYIYRDNDTLFFLIGHAFDPFHSIIDENILLKNFAHNLRKGEKFYWDNESDLTGVFVTGFITDKSITYSTDCCGMQYICHGVIDDNLYVCSHSKLVADICNLEQDNFVKRLINTRTWHFYGSWLPGDISPFAELKRLPPNIKGVYNYKSKKINIKRYYPTEAIHESQSEEEYFTQIHKLGKIMSNSLSLIAKKWEGLNIGISVTGGRDSMTTLSCANGMYDKFSYFSYISNDPESIDAYAANKICTQLGLEHSIYEIPKEPNDAEKNDVFGKILECNAGCIWENNANDVRKRLYFIEHPKFDIEVKSWLNEIGRGWYYKKYQKASFPKYPKAKMLRTMHKPYLSPYIIRETTKIFKKWIDTYYCGNVLNKISWVDLFYWDFTWSGNEGICLTSEHRVSYEITIPFNNRKYFELMLSLPLKKRVADKMPIDLISIMNKTIIESGIVVKDVNLSDLRTLLVRTYFAIFSKI